MNTTILSVVIILGSLFICIIILIIWFTNKTRQKPGHENKEDLEAKKESLVNKYVKNAENESLIQVYGLFSDTMPSCPDRSSTCSLSLLSLSVSDAEESSNTHAEEEKVGNVTKIETNTEDVENCTNVTKSCQHEDNDTDISTNYLMAHEAKSKRKDFNYMSKTFIIEAKDVSHKIQVSTPLRRESSFVYEEKVETPVKSDMNQMENFLQTSLLNAIHTEIKGVSSAGSSEVIKKVLTETVVDITDDDIVIHEDIEDLSEDKSKYYVKQSPSLCEVGAECDSKIFQSSVVEISHQYNCYNHFFNNHLSLSFLVRIFMRKYGNTF